VARTAARQAQKRLERLKAKTTEAKAEAGSALTAKRAADKLGLGAKKGRHANWSHPKASGARHKETRTRETKRAKRAKH